MQPNFYAIIPATVRYDKNLRPNAKLLYGEITALCNQEGFCWADNAYFANLYKVDNKTISRWISSLEKGSYLVIEHFPNNGNTRKIYIENTAQSLVTKKSLPSDKKVTTLVIKKSLPSDKKVTPLYENITINNTMNREDKALAFFEVNSPSEWETFQMRFRKQFDEKEWLKFKELFDCKVDEEGLEFTTKIISARLNRFAINYCENLKKRVTKEISIESGVNHPSRKKIA
jgi:hypothetical protein